MRRDIYYGGSFNPFHDGHSEIIDELLTIPNFNGNYNGILIDPSVQNIWNKELIPRSVRLAIIQESFRSWWSPRVRCLTHPITETNNSTYEAIETLIDRQVFGEDVSIVIGTDQVAQIEKWYRYQDLIDRHEFIIVKRPSYNLGYNIFKKYKVINMDNPISSTAIRENLWEDSVEKMMSMQGLNIFRGYFKGAENENECC